jgi:competence protein ComEC
VAFTSLVAGLATGPFALYHFNRFADYGLVANLIAVPLTGLWVMPWGVLALLLMPFGAEWLALQPMSLGLDAIAASARMVAAWPGAVSLVPAMPPMALLLISFGGLWLCLWRRRARLLAAVPLSAALIVCALARPPDLLVDGEARLFAVRTSEGALWLSSRRQARFIGDAWLRQAGRGEAGPWSLDAGSGFEAMTSEEPSTVEGAMCDAEACAFEVRGQRVSILRNRGALAEECARADIVIALMPMRSGCRGPRLMIDRFDLWREGTHALWLDDGRAMVETVRAARGQRPWALPRTTREKRSAAGGGVRQ